MRIEIVGHFDVNTINSAITSTIRQLLRVTLQKTWELQQCGYSNCAECYSEYEF